MKNNQKKVIGILGGFGPYATNDFFKALLDNTETKKDWDHMHIIMDNKPCIPSRARAFLFDEDSPLPYLIEGVERLEKASADFFVCPCNSAHYFIRQDLKSFPLPFLDMVKLTIDEIKRKGLKKIGILGSEVTVQSKMYENELINNNIEVFNVERIEDVRFVIETAKQMIDLDKGKEKMLTLINDFKDKGVEAVIYACTELPIVLPETESPLIVFDSSNILAQETIKFAQK